MKEKLFLAIAITSAILCLYDWSSPIRVRNTTQTEAIADHIARLQLETLP
ncbi:MULTISPECIES: hypothetical protein [Leptolyngbya]|uniref:Uncharacterized protein n=1 Tax=Leptolyngbya boryana CZ1 TaxID=3060204 RepID=A0AA96XAY1_LEPBY|nr:MULTISPECIES: hypothetical protein [Leptolyngbya]MBD1855694.1 hypothetical protein [Leptolyngbya sp. FACHB-1624]MBN8564716.1 hypothetical protein [Leptolyngbya sp. UWPOB_LEPTO1]MCY6488586.1 hypothetical protein [Leptolyngbya sp. GGD]WNZ48800.1 hypothetical protein Q2T42_13295 [Leptolyngbya boryana CZ1]